PATRIFATDGETSNIEKARVGLFDEAALQGLPAGYRDRFFTHIDEGYRLNNAIRDRCVFGGHRLGKDPPFARMDLIVCRQPPPDWEGLGDRIARNLHYALRPGGCLILDYPELIGASNLLSCVDKTNGILARVISPYEPD